MKKNLTLLVGIIIIVILVIGGYAIFDKTSKPTVSSNSSTAKKSQTKTIDNSILITKTSPSIGSYLAEPNGYPLYTYSGDQPNVSKVTGSLLALWPAYQDKGSTANLPTGVGTIKRTNGEIQFTYNKMPLYTFVNDKPGQVTGNGISNFYVARPSSSTTTSSSTQTKTTTNNSSSSAY